MVNKQKCLRELFWGCCDKIPLSDSTRASIALMRIYVRIGNFTIKPRFQSADL